jgi:hypothetical protein
MAPGIIFADLESLGGGVTPPGTNVVFFGSIGLRAPGIIFTDLESLGVVLPPGTTFTSVF